MIGFTTIYLITHVWRNFPISVSNNPRVLLSYWSKGVFILLNDDAKNASKVYPWAFMGTLWSLGSRTLLIKIFERPPAVFFCGNLGQACLLNYRNISFLLVCFSTRGINIWIPSYGNLFLWLFPSCRPQLNNLVFLALLILYRYFQGGVLLWPMLRTFLLALLSLIVFNLRFFSGGSICVSKSS